MFKLFGHPGLKMVHNGTNPAGGIKNLDGRDRSRASGLCKTQQVMMSFQGPCSGEKYNQVVTRS